MSFVTTPMRSSSPSERQSAATSELLPEPTGPPIPIRRARSAGKEPRFAGGMSKRAQLQRGRETARQRAGIVRHRGGGELCDEPPGLDEPGGGVGGVDRQQLHRRSGDGGRVVVEKCLSDVAIG